MRGKQIVEKHASHFYIYIFGVFCLLCTDLQTLLELQLICLSLSPSLLVSLCLFFSLHLLLFSATFKSLHPLVLFYFCPVPRWTVSSIDTSVFHLVIHNSRESTDTKRQYLDGATGRRGE